MTDHTTLHLVRHGQVHNPNDIFYGRMPRFRLSDLGRRQAAWVGKHFAAAYLAAVYSSPLLRARQTANIIAGIAGAPRHQSSLILEVKSPLQGIPLAELKARNYDLYTGSPAEYEQPDDVLDRVQRFMHHLVRRHPGQTIAAVSHGDVLLIAYLWAAGTHPTPKSMRSVAAAGQYPTHAGMYTFRLKSEDNRPEFLGYTQPDPSVASPPD
jgi:broad specificity phosphatase PhoE